MPINKRDGKFEYFGKIMPEYGKGFDIKKMPCADLKIFEAHEYLAKKYKEVMAVFKDEGITLDNSISFVKIIVDPLVNAMEITIEWKN